MPTQASSAGSRPGDSLETEDDDVIVQVEEEQEALATPRGAEDDAW